MITIWVTLIVTMQQMSSTPLVVDKIVDPVEDLFYGAKDLANMNEMMIIDNIAAKMDETDPFKGTNASVKFQNFMYTIAELPMDLGTDIIESVANIEGTLDKFEHNMHVAVADDADAASEAEPGKSIVKHKDTMGKADED
ncbi:uncharacterized protein LOC119074376 [Bradysia coprophila]|uniref:uncharacterized protein LOC119074376 n=1 Tax=Bradysia coprophila TaxID=38358 RepID=UPI00187D96C0|nr:uncharacterized protein LOC119074376 [Bradysia coprophila]